MTDAQPDSLLPQRKPLRLRLYDYSQAGAYFVTVCTQDRQCFFGEIAGDDMHANDAGKMITRWWHELAHKFPSLQVDDCAIMPNHFHGVLSLGGTPGSGPTLGDIMEWFKSMTTNEYIRGVKQYGWRRFAGRLWQRNYYEHVIRNEDDLGQIREYIRTNPAKWSLDRENPLARHP